MAGLPVLAAGGFPVHLFGQGGQQPNLPFGLAGQGCGVTFRCEAKGRPQFHEPVQAIQTQGALGAWIHASLAPPVLLGDPKFRHQYGAMLGFDWSVPRWKPLDILRWQVILPWTTNVRATTVGLRHQGEHLIKAMCPPNYPTMGDAVDAVMAEKFGPRGIYADKSLFARIYRGEFGAEYLREASNYSADVIACARDICTYIFQTHGRFPAHCDTIHVPGVWLQAHHVEEGYYQQFFRNGLTEEHQLHDRRWHPAGRHE